MMEQTTGLTVYTSKFDRSIWTNNKNKKTTYKAILLNIEPISEEERLINNKGNNGGTNAPRRVRK